MLYYNILIKFMTLNLTLYRYSSTVTIACNSTDFFTDLTYLKAPIHLHLFKIIYKDVDYLKP